MNLSEIKNIILKISNQNKMLLALVNDKDRIIEELMYKVEQLQSDLEYSKVNSGIKKLVLTNNNMIKYRKDWG